MKSLTPYRSSRCRTLGFAVLTAVVAAVWIGNLVPGHRVFAQKPEPIVDARDIASVLNDQPQVEAGLQSQSPTSIDLLSLITRGGGFMIPIGLMSFLVVALAAERLITLRRGKVMPSRLVRELSDESEVIEHFHPSTAYEICQNYPSPFSASRSFDVIENRTAAC